MKTRGKFGPKLKFDPTNFIKNLDQCDANNWSSDKIDFYMKFRNQNHPSEMIYDYLNYSVDPRMRLNSASVN